MALGAGAIPVAAAGAGGGSAARAAAHGPRTKPAVAAVVRVDQVGYAVGSSKRAYLMSPVAEPSATFSVVDPDGTVVDSGMVGTQLGSWSKRYSHVYAIDFDSLTQPGTYSVAVQGAASARSPVFEIADAADLYRQPLANALSFYQNERDGPDFIPSALRSAPGHLNDEHAMTYLTPKTNGQGGFKGDLTPSGTTIDASGGWWDAGDYLKFVETTSYTVALMLVGVRDFPTTMGSATTTSDFTAEAQFGLQWLQRMWDDSTETLYYQVGIGAGNGDTVSDHDIWRLPQADDTFGGSNPDDRYIRNRPVFRAGPPGSPISPNLAGRLTADFALCYQVFRASDPTEADSCLRSAEDVYALADTHPHGLLTALPHSFYPETSWTDDMELGATELTVALDDGPPPAGLPQSDPSFYLQQAGQWAGDYLQTPIGDQDVLNLYDVSGLAHFELTRTIAASGDPAGLAVTSTDLVADLGRQLARAQAQGRRDPFGFGFPWAAYDTASHGSGLSVEASEYDDLTGASTYAPDAVRWLGNVLGANSWGSSFIVGDGDTFPQCMQHQVANLVGSLDGSPPILAGAVVEGPNTFAAHGHLSAMRACPAGGGNIFGAFNGHGAVYRDDEQSYSTVEPAIDLTASSPLAFSWMVTRP